MNNEELLKAKKDQLQALKREIRELEGSRNLSAFTTKDIIHAVKCERKDGEVKPIALDARRGRYDIWERVRYLSERLYFTKERLSSENCERYSSEGILKVKDMTPEQLKMSARFCDEVITIYNKYVVEANPTMEFYGVTCTPWDKFDLSELI